MLKRTFFPTTLAAMLALAFAVACSPPTDGDSPGLEAAKGGPGGGGPSPTVTAVDPSEAPQGTTLDVTVQGSNYDEGSSVDLLLDGEATLKVKTNSTNFDPDKPGDLVANITIADDAVVGLYDVRVTTSRGKKGIGIEKFAVKQTGNPHNETILHFVPTIGGSQPPEPPGVYGDGAGAYVSSLGKNCSENRDLFLIPPPGMPSNMIMPPVCPADGRSRIYFPGDPFAGDQASYGAPVAAYEIIGKKVQPRGAYSPALNYYWDGCVVSGHSSRGCNFLWTDAFVTNSVSNVDGVVITSTVIAGCAKLFIGNDTLQIEPSSPPTCDSRDKAGNTVLGFPLELHVDLEKVLP